MDRKDTISSFGDLFKAFRQRRHLTQQEVAAQCGVHRNTIGRWERGDVLPNTRGVVLEVARILHLDEQETRRLLEASLTALAPYWNVPFRRNPLFTGREELLRRLHEYVQADQASGLPPSYALQGLGGMGKTHTAVEYAYRQSQDYAAIFWIEAETSESIVSSCMRIAELLQLPEQQQAEQQRIVAAVQRWLEHHRDWLLIWDNVEDVDLLQRFLPVVRQGTILITTRCQALGTLAQRIELGPLTQEEGMQFLLRRAKIVGAATSPEQLHRLAEHTPGEYTAAQELVRLMDGLPLALDQVGAYLEETGCGLAPYLRAYERHRQQLLARRGIPLGEHSASVAATFTLAYKQVERVHPAAAELLCLCAFLAPDEIPEELLVGGAPHLGPVLQPVAADPYQLDGALAALRSFSLVQRQAETQALTIHRLVQAVVKDQLEPANVRLWTERAVHTVNAAFPQKEFANWPRCERCLPHAHTCRLLIEQTGISIPEAARLFYKAGDYLLERGRYREAQPFLEQALALQEQQLGPEHPDVATTLNCLGGLSWSQGQYKQAEPLLRRALAIREQQAGPTHLSTAETLCIVAVVSWNLGQYEQAESLWERALAIREQQAGPTHLSTGESLNNLGFAYWQQGNYEQAEPLLQRALAICEQQLGPDHPLTATNLGNLGVFYQDLGNYEQAEPLLLRSLVICEQQLGPTHPHTAIDLARLGVFYQNRGNYEQAEPLLLRSLAIWEKQLGPNPFYLANGLRRLGMLYRDLGNYEQAESLLQRALAIYEQQLGPDHLDTVLSLQELALLYQHQGRNEQAELLRQRVSTLFEQQTHPAVVHHARRRSASPRAVNLGSVEQGSS